MQSCSAIVNQDVADLVAPGSSDYLLFLEFLQRAQIEWAEALDYEWEELYSTFLPAITGTGATIALPWDFHKVAGPPINWSTNSNGDGWPYVVPEERTIHNASDKYFYVLGNQNTGFNMIWNPPTLNSGTSLEIPYFAIPASLASSGQITVCPDSQFMIDRATAYVLEARYDSRFQEMEAKARERLLQMVDNHNVKKYDSFAGNIPVRTTNYMKGWRIGRD